MMVSNTEPYANALVRPTSLEAARTALAADPELRPIGGGTAIVPELRAGARPRRWMATDAIEGLDGVSVDSTGDLVIGAAARLRQIELDPRVRDGWPLLADAISAVAGPAIRNMATIGGSLALGRNSPDPAVALRAFEARVSVMGAGAELPVEALPTVEDAEGPLLIETIHVPPAGGMRWSRERFTVRGESDRPFVIVAVVVGPARTTVTVGVGRPRPVQLSGTATAIEQSNDWRVAIDADLAGLPMRDTDRGSGAYRKRVLRALVVRAVAGALATEADA